MTRSGFLKSIAGLAIGIAMAPAIKLLAEEETICNRGLLWHAQQAGQTLEYNSNITMADFDELIKALEKRNG